MPRPISSNTSHSRSDSDSTDGRAFVQLLTMVPQTMQQMAGHLGTDVDLSCEDLSDRFDDFIGRFLFVDVSDRSRTQGSLGKQGLVMHR